MEQLIAQKLHITKNQVTNVIDLLEQGATIPFIARYRKEKTGSLDETIITSIQEEIALLKKLQLRKATINKRLKELNIQNPDLLDKINRCFDPAELEDIYLPYRPKRRTRAQAAREKGLEPLAKMVMSQRGINWKNKIQGKMTVEEAVEGIKDIIAEWVNEHAYARKSIRQQYESHALLVSKVIKAKKTEASKYKDYFDFDQRLRNVPSHRFLAISRGEKEGLLRVKLEIDKERALNKLSRIFLKSSGYDADLIYDAIVEGFKRLMAPSIEKEVMNKAKEKADEEAINIFGENLKQLLMTPPLGEKNLIAIDPGYRTGCKVACLNHQGGFQSYSTIFPHPPQHKTHEARETIQKLIRKHKIEAIAIGDGTAGRETFQFINSMVKESGIDVHLINEAGASIYSASENAREEFPDLDLTVRGAISIGRRLMDPLSELVKIDPKSIGVGQYQHDVNQDKLKERLDAIVVNAVNKVGVNLNTAGYHLMKYVSGIGPKLAKNIVQFRKENGAFISRKQLNKVPGLGPKAYEQCAGFLRINEGINPLDSSGVHPERYPLIKSMAEDLNEKVEQLIRNTNLISSIIPTKYINQEIGLPTINDIMAELGNPGLDPRGKPQKVVYDEGVHSFEDLIEGMQLNGRITNLTKFGAFVDIGIKENGLIHISQITDRFIKDPAEILNLGQAVKVSILSLDEDRKRIQLSMKGVPQ